MAHIYKITNQLNNKIYIGKTEYSNPERRFVEHVNDKNRFPERPLYRAMNKYGVENFIFEIIEETDYPEEREIYWIQHYNSYGSTGYNATLGGDGKKYINEEKIIEDYARIGILAEVARINNCHSDSVKNILERKNIQVDINPRRRKVKIVELDQNFDSINEATDFLIREGYTNSTINTVRTAISRISTGKRKTYLKMHFEFS